MSTNAIAQQLGTRAASVTDMIQRLASKSLVDYEKYYGVMLTKHGRSVAIELIRRHRLWETFLVDKLGFQWDQVHDMAEELEHVASIELISRLDDFLGNPKFDPHGDPIPDKDGNIAYHEDVKLDSVESGQEGLIVGVVDHTPDFLKYLDKNGLIIKAHVKVVQIEEYDNSRTISINRKQSMTVSQKVAANILIRRMR